MLTPFETRTTPVTHSLPEVNILLVGKDEAPAGFMVSETGIGSLGQPDGDSLEILMASGADADTLAMRMTMDVVTPRLPDELRQTIDELGLKPDLPSYDEALQRIPQKIAHAISEIAEIAVSQQAEIWYRERRGESLLKQLRYLGKMALGLPVVATASTMLVAELSGNSSSNPVITALAFTGSYALVNGYLGYKKIKSWVTSSTAQEEGAKMLGAQLGRQVHQDIHDSFCSAVFDARQKKHQSDD